MVGYGTLGVAAAQTIGKLSNDHELVLSAHGVDCKRPLSIMNASEFRAEKSAERLQKEREQLEATRLRRQQQRQQMQLERELAEQQRAAAAAIHQQQQQRYGAVSQPVHVQAQFDPNVRISNLNSLMIDCE